MAEMSSTMVASQDRHARIALDFLQNVLGEYHPRNFAVELWDGTTWEAETGKPLFTIVLKHPGALRRMFLPPNELTMGEAYIFGDFEVRGSLHDMMRLAEFLLDEQEWGLWQQLSAAWSLLRLPRALPVATEHRAELGGEQHSITRDRQAIRYHYDVNNEFYSLFLDERMVYSCAYFADAEESLDAAQARKLDYICRKLRLQSGDRLLDIGCGWGALVMHAAQYYGAYAHGITLSERQADLAEERIAAAGLSDRCRVEVLDYREIEEEGGYDKLVSVGMVEHVGSQALPIYFAQAWRLLRPAGAFPEPRHRHFARARAAHAFLHAQICLPRWRVAADQPHVALRREGRLRSARPGKPARALCPHAQELGATPASETASAPSSWSTRLPTAPGSCTCPARSISSTCRSITSTRRYC